MWQGNNDGNKAQSSQPLTLKEKHDPDEVKATDSPATIERRKARRMKKENTEKEKIAKEQEKVLIPTPPPSIFFHTRTESKKVTKDDQLPPPSHSRKASLKPNLFAV